MEQNFLDIYKKVYDNIEKFRDNNLVEVIENNILLEKIHKNNPNYDEKIIKSIGLSLLILLNLEMCK